MNNALFVSLSKFRLFWLLRAWGRKLLFRIEARHFGARNQFKEGYFKIQSFRYLLGITQSQLFLALVFAIFLQFTDSYLHYYYKYFHLPLLPSEDDYVTLLATISGIGGVFIGLYYAAIATVGGAIYARVPNNIRDLLTQERFGSFYMRFLSFITFLGLILIALHVLGYPRIPLAVLIMTISAGIGIIAFVNLGQRVFNLFDPTALSLNIFEQLQRWVKTVQVGGLLWNDKSFQAHAHKWATSNLDTLETLADISSKEQHLNGQPYVDLCKNILRFLLVYEHRKKLIPTKSFWYEQKYVQKEWYRTEDSTVSMAYQTATTLHPETSNDPQWIERKLLPIVCDCIAVNLNQNRNQLILGLLHNVDIYLKCLAENHQLLRALDVLEKISATIYQNILNTEEKHVLEEEVLDKLALTENLAYLPISILLGYITAIENTNKQSLEKMVSHVNWRNQHGIYRQAFPLHLLPQLEWLKPRLDFEYQVEGKIISPLWYQTEIVRQEDAKQFAENIHVVVDNVIDFYNKWLEKTEKEKHPWLSAAIISREWEYWNKVDYHVYKIEESWNEIDAVRRIDGLDWSHIDFEGARKKILMRQKELLDHMALENTLLSLGDRPAEFPDYAGQFLHVIGEALIDALCAADIAKVQSLYRPYFIGCMMQFEKLRPRKKDTDWRTQIDIKVASAPLLDLMDVSGYARLLADYHDNDLLWNEVTKVWDEHLNGEHAEMRMKILAGAVSITDAGFELAHRSGLRTAWQSRVEHQLADVPRKDAYYKGTLASYTIIQHQSPLVRIFAEDSMGSFHDGIDIFIALYLRGQSEAKELDFGWRRRDFVEALDREKERYSQHPQNEGVDK